MEPLIPKRKCLKNEGVVTSWRVPGSLGHRRAETGPLEMAAHSLSVTPARAVSGGEGGRLIE